MYVMLEYRGLGEVKSNTIKGVSGMYYVIRSLSMANHLVRNGHDIKKSSR